ncbi:acyl-CoA mutase large subunit family protein [Aneurinibacillus sp. BA2021]|nr:acyl-CoA mutase large subunit family protein [Aneurinibacillus sp. BA2021]
MRTETENETMQKTEQEVFQAFSPPTYEQWRAAAEKTLKGGSFEKRLVTQTYEEIALQPIYMKEAMDKLPHAMLALPGVAPYMRGTNTTGYAIAPWEVAQEIGAALPEELNAKARFDRERGQTALTIPIDIVTRLGYDADEAAAVGFGGLSLSTVEDVEQVLAGISTADTPLYMTCGRSGWAVLALVAAALKKSGASVAELRGCIGSDPLGTLVQEGVLPGGVDAAYDGLAQATSWAAKHAPQVKTIVVEGHPYHDGGGSAVQELAFALATGTAYIRALQERELEIDAIASHMMFSFSVGTNVFMEIAKLRAARVLWSQIVRAFGGTDDASRMTMHARTSAWTKTMYDPYVNMLRVTAESFAAVLGGVNSLHVSPFDEVIGEADEFSRRIARNTQLLLAEEAHLAKVIDPAGGSWYIETLTDEVAAKAWALFQEIEAAGGMEAALQSGVPQQHVNATREARVRNIESRRDRIVGVNMYANRQETVLERPKPDRDAIRTARIRRLEAIRSNVDRSEKKEQHLADLRQGKTGRKRMKTAIQAARACATLGELMRARTYSHENTFVQALEPNRAAAGFESLRQAAEAYEARTGEPPRVHLVTLGVLAKHKPRADFATGFFEVGGFAVSVSPGHTEAKEAAEAAHKTGVDLFVLCGSDEAYAEMAQEVIASLREGNPSAMILLAGVLEPDLLARCHAAGLNDTIHAGTNCYNTLLTLQKQKGIRG